MGSLFIFFFLLLTFLFVLNVTVVIIILVIQLVFSKALVYAVEHENCVGGNDFSDDRGKTSCPPQIQLCRPHLLAFLGLKADGASVNMYILFSGSYLVSLFMIFLFPYSVSSLLHHLACPQLLFSLKCRTIDCVVRCEQMCAKHDLFYIVKGVVNT